MRISDVIAAYINRELDNAASGEARFRRNELAEELGCVPSQINYVITSRFTPEQGFIVDSRRGGGGYIQIRRVRYLRDAQALMHTINAIGSTLSMSAGCAILDNLSCRGVINAETARVMSAAMSDQACRELPVQIRDRLRAEQFKCMLASIVT